MNMASEFTAEKACGQLLICLKMSKLNYIVNETPFSAYITIRKKFLRNVKPEDLDTVKPPVESVTDKATIGKLEEEVFKLKQKLEFLYKDNGHLKFELEEQEVKYEALEEEKDSLETNFETFIEKQKTQKFELEKQKEKSKVLEEEKDTIAKRVDDLKTEGAKLSKENKALQLKVKNQEIKLQDKSDSVDILKHSVHNKCLETETGS